MAPLLSHPSPLPLHPLASIFRCTRAQTHTWIGAHILAGSFAEILRISLMQSASAALPRRGGSSGGAGVAVVTAGLLLETSLGPLAVDLFGADCSALTANFLNLCRAQLWNGAVATEVVPDVAVFFSLAADPVYKELLEKLLRSHSAGAAAPPGPGPLNFWSLLPRQDHAEGDASPTVSTATVSLHSHAAASVPSTADPVEQQETAVRRAMQQEARLCKRRRCVGLAPSRAGDRNTKGGYKPVYVHASGSSGAAVATNAAHVSASPSASSPCTVCRAGSLLVDASAPTLRFGLTLSDRTMDFLDKQYITIGVVREGEAVLRRIRRAPVRDRCRDDAPTTAGAGPLAAVGIVAGRPALSWPRPVRMLRVKRATVLPTAGTEKYVTVPPSAWWGVSSTAGSAAAMEQQRQRTAAALHQAGCFEWWASEAAVRAAHRELVELVRSSLVAHGYVAITRPRTVADASIYLQTAAASTGRHAAQPLIVVAAAPAQTRSDGEAATSPGELELVCNPHYAGDYLSSEDDDTEGFHDGGQPPHHSTTAALSAKQLEERRKSFMQQHQEKANETLSLMLNLLNGVADVRGDIKPPDNVLFVCKLNPVTTGEGLALCFSQFGRVTSADVIYDAKTKQSLCYGFVEFESVEACFRAFQKMDRALIDDCRIHVDFSQSVSKLWAQRQREMRKRDRVALEGVAVTRKGIERGRQR
ncbi:conserved hypothetical protein [Leishmania infantum JPCM5]|uniref:Peptidyl-prolyl cis-trans isomerase n=2 Tax=Leishmania infantum TaxID=5671 RepID=A0A6L0WXS0_LEIIN|nr:conserved hypothetical protein [Leishmania infantum JPCM5]CAC9474975.1 RNA_recognition_motif_(a.k.a._RRM_-_RBD_-_or_RNP_domain)/RNA_recognition_motif._(a.k.a._RRM_-_RBD_-_or_RNP_domain)_-_putative [Leishmania infantum]CAM66945.1 conserved hypothetical protein [Leishmania infantum JPCM5]SUZ40644.1 RNA_recognition_motif_(a.k.a._RRM_-_RBD_-_or_RNP_domain)/RNA_recognition_motif._(a.k.a._RRM_-_RBD_-_or_RNP_domain)_-_putative [Leishmania infantum]|eukprot:XP_001464554.1 conserved hypothetical protein [Leishmania infantum JPCM5]